MQNFLKKKLPKFGIKNALFGNVSARFLKTQARFLKVSFLKSYCHICNQHRQICKIAKFHEKQNCLRFGSQMHDLGIFGLEF